MPNFPLSSDKGLHSTLAGSVIRALLNFVLPTSSATPRRTKSFHKPINRRIRLLAQHRNRLVVSILNPPIIKLKSSSLPNRTTYLSQTLDRMKCTSTSTDDHDARSASLVARRLERWEPGLVLFECVGLVSRNLDLAINNFGFEGMERVWCGCIL